MKGSLPLVLALPALIGAGLIAWPAADSPRNAPRELRVSGTHTQIRIWEEGTGGAYQVSLDGGRSWHEPAPAETLLKLRYREFDPLLGEPPVDGRLLAPAGSRLFLVQFWTQTLDAYRSALVALGAEVNQFVPHQAWLVRMDPDLAGKVRELPFVRWVGAYHAAYRLDEQILGPLQDGGLPDAPAKYNLQFLAQRGPDRGELTTTVERIGGTVVNAPPENILIEAMLTPEQLVRIAGENTVLYIDPWSEIGYDMDLARQQGGANYIEPMKPSKYTGKGIRGMILEGIYATHPEFAAISPWRTTPLVNGSATADGHGNSTFGEVFAMGVRAQARGLLPDGQGIYCNASYVSTFNARYQVLKDLVDPTKQFRGMFQTASWGDTQVTTYTTRSAEMDTIIFDLDVPITQSQSNTGTQSSRPQAWAKNIISVGGIKHLNTLATSDDNWGRGASIGPAADGRVKPDLCAYYDSIYTTGSSASSYTTSFGGTSGATPIVAGHVGLALELYTDGLFGHPAAASWDKRFEARPHFTTTKAHLINTARQYPFPNNKDFTRFNQGWGWPSVQDMYDLRAKTHIVDEWDALRNLESREYLFFVAPGEAQLRATMTYADPSGTTSATLHRINNVDLKATDPAGTVYWGNNGLTAGNSSTPGGTANQIDTVENVFVQNPRAGLWRVLVRAAQLNQDARVETPGVTDVDYALVVSGIGSGRDRSRLTLDLATTGRGDLKVDLQKLPAGWSEGWTFLSLDRRLPAGLGSFLGIEADALSLAVAGLPGAPGSFLHFTYTANPALFPNAPYQVPAGTLTALKGIGLDGVTIVFGRGGNLLDVANASRVTL